MVINIIKITVNPHEDFHMVVHRFYRYTTRVKAIAGCTLFHK